MTKLANDKVTFVKAEEDTNDSIKRYDIEFYTGNTKYDYEINADTGEVIEFDKDIRTILYQLIQILYLTKLK